MAFYQRSINAAFRKTGLSLAGDAFKRLKVFLGEYEFGEDESVNTVLQGIVTKVKENGTTSLRVDLQTVEKVLAMLKDEEVAAQEVYRYMDAFDTPKKTFDSVRKVFYDAKQSSIKGTVMDRADCTRDRYHMIKQRLMRNELFSPPTVNSGDEYYQITPIESLISNPGSRCIFGLLIALQEGKYFVEDLTGSIQLDISEAEMTQGLFTEGCMVLVEGEIIENIFVVTTMGFPPPEMRSETITNFPDLDCFGIELNKDQEKERIQLRSALENENSDDMIIVLSDVYLDKPRVMQQLEVLLNGYAPICPPLFVLMGNFVSQPLGHGSGDIDRLTRYFDDLTDLILKFPSLVEASKFILIPGPNDIGFGNVLPRPGLPKVFTKRMRRKLPDTVVFASNPARVLYCTKELVFFREDLLHKMRRNCIKAPVDVDNTEISEHLVKTVLDQSHLCPLPMNIRPIYWGYDHAMRVYPFPHALILGDVVDQYDWTYDGCHAFNPGCFSSDFSFVVYWPAKDKAEFSRIE